MSQHLQEPIDPNTRTHDDRGAGSIGSVGMLFCDNCGTSIPPQARFCTKCGQPLPTTGQMSSMPFGQGSSFPPYHAPVGPYPQASPATPLPSPATEEATQPTVNQERISTTPLVSSPPKGGAIPIIRNWWGGNNQDGWRRRIRSRRFLTIALIALIVVPLGSSLPFLLPYLHSILPASSATVTITPASQNFSKTYAIFAVTGTPDASQHQVGARLLSYTTPAKSQTVKATGAGHQDATYATGKLTISNATGTETISGRITSSSGVNLYFVTPVLISPNNVTLADLQAANPGSGGNIPAYDINGYFYNSQNPNITYFAQNTSAFTGGQDASDYTFVQQSDIDGVANPLVTQLTSDAQTRVQNQVHANEQLTGDIQCNPKISSNHQANDKATDVTVTVSVTCQGEVYDLQAAQAMATDSLKSDAASQLGANYALAGNVTTGTPTIGSTDQGGTVSMAVDAQGLWVFQFSDAQKQSLAQTIAGKTQADASALLLKQQGVSKVSINPSGGLGTALPSAENIKWVVVSLPGL